MSAHQTIGIVVLALTVAHIAWRRIHRPPPPPVAVHALTGTAARITHWLLSALLLCLPLTAWVMSSVPHRPSRWLGLFAIPPLPVSSTTARFGQNGHSVLGYLMGLLVAIHIAADVRHE